MASYSYKLKDNSDLCHYKLASEKEFGVQCCLIRDANNCKDYSTHHYTLYQSMYESKQPGAAFLQVSTPGKAFDKFDQEKHKIVIPVKAYFKLLEFFISDWSLVLRRCESDYNDMKQGNGWISLTPSISFRGTADVIYKSILDSTNVADLELIITKRGDTLGKMNIMLAYTDEKLGSIHLPPAPFSRLAQELSHLVDLYEYKEIIATKKSRQS